MAENSGLRVYLLSPKELSPETIAVAFAKTSRSPESFREIAEGLTDEKSADFHEKWVVGYGHASVAEHAVLHLAFENVSRLAIECLESNRLASYTEKSTRYQRWKADSFHRPEEVRTSRHLALYEGTCQRLFQTYLDSLPAVEGVVRQLNPPSEHETQAAWESRLRSKYVDVCRFLLPAAALANVGMTANARVLEHALGKMLSHPLQEVREIGRAAKAACMKEVPTLLKYAETLPYLSASGTRLRQMAGELAPAREGDWLQLLAYDPQGEQRVLAAALVEHGHCGFEQAMAAVAAMDPDRRKALAEAVLGSRGRFDAPLRVLEHASFMFQVEIDQGGYFELKRHRLMTQTPQPLDAGLGFAVPRLIVEAGRESTYRQAMRSAAEAAEQLAEWNAHVAGYLIPNAFRRRALLSLNLREAFHFCELRAAPNAHFSVRRLALRMAEELKRVHPLLAGYLRLPAEVNWRQLEGEHFAQV
jgi:thymidylate synthase ThyX